MIEKFYKVTRKEKTVMGRKELLSLIERVDSNSSATPAEISFDGYIFDTSDDKKNVTQSDFVSLLKAASKCKHLRIVSFPNDFLINEVTIDPIISLFSNKHIREVRFNHAIGLNGENLEKVFGAIRDSKHLSSLGVRGAQFTPEDLDTVVSKLRGHSSIHELSFQWCDLRAAGTARIAELVGAGSRIRSLDLRGNNIGAEGCKTLGAALRENGSVETLHLEENEIGSLGAAYVCHVLFGRESGSVALRNIFLDSNYIGDNGALAAATTLEKCGGIVQLSLRDNGIHAKCGSKIAAAALKSDSLTYLDLESNFLTDEGALQFAIVIEKNAKLKYLNLANNGIREVGGEKIGQALMRNNCLISLDLQSNNLNADSVSEMGRSLERNTTLEYLYLGWNDIRDRGAYILSPVLGKNSVLIELTLESNAIGPDGGVRLALGLEKNITLQTLAVAGNPIEGGAQESMDRSLSRNHKIVEFFEVLKAGNTDRAKDLLPVMPERLQGILVNHETILEAVCSSGNKRSVAFVLKELLVRRTMFPEFSGRRQLNSEETMLVVVGLKSINTSHPVRFIKNKDGDTLLHWIARESEHFSGENAVTIVSYLVSVECSPNARSLVTGLTPLHYSRTAGVALELIRNGADVGACDLQGCGIESHLKEDVLDAVREYIGHGEDYILGVIGIGSKALGGHQNSAAEQFIQTLTLPKDASFVDFSQGPWWKKVEGAPQSLPLGCFPVITVPTEDPKTGVVANIKVRVCDLDHLSELFVNDNGIIIVCAFSLDSCELQTETEAAKQKQIIAKWLKKSPNTFPILAALDPSRDEEHMRKLREKNTVISPPTDALYHARHNGFCGYSEIEVVQPFKPVLMDAVQIALRFHLAKLGRGAPLPEGDVMGCGCFVREIKPVEGCDQPRKYVKAFIFGADGSGKSSLVDIIAPKKRTIRTTRKSSDGLDVCDLTLAEVDVKKGSPELVCVLYDLAGKPQYVTVHEFILARHSALFVLAVDLSLDDPLAQVRGWLAPLHYHPDGPTDGCKILIVGTKADKIVVDGSGGSSSKKQNLSAAIYAKKDKILKYVRSYPTLAKLPVEFVHMSTKASDLKEAFRDIFFSFLADIQKAPVPRAYNEASDYFESSILGKPAPAVLGGGTRYFFRIGEFRSLFPNIEAIRDDDDYIDFLNYLYDCGQILLDQSLDFVCTQPIFMLKGYRALLGPGAGADIAAPAAVAATAATSASAPASRELEREDALARLAAVAGLDDPRDREFLLELVRRTGFCFSPSKKPNLLVFPSLYPRCPTVLEAAKDLAPTKSEIFEMTCLEWHCRSCGASGEGALPKECPNCREMTRFKQKCTAHCDDCKKALAAHEGLPMYLRRGVDVIDPTLYTGIRPFSGDPCEITLAHCDCLQKLKKKKIKGLCEKITYPCDVGTAVGLWFGIISQHYDLIDRSVLFSNAANFNDPYGNLVTLFFDAHSVPGQLQIYILARGVVPELWPETFARLIDFGPRTPVCPKCAAMLILSSKQDKYTCVNGHEFPSTGMMVIDQ